MICTEMPLRSATIYVLPLILSSPCRPLTPPAPTPLCSTCFVRLLELFLDIMISYHTMLMWHQAFVHEQQQQVAELR